jgi:hypothetical protein
VIAYRATVDVPRELAQFTAKLLAAERRRRRTPKGSRALTCFWQAVLGLRLRLWALYHLGELGDSAPQAIAVGEPLLEDAERELGPDHRSTLAVRNNLANAYRAAGRAAEAIPLHQQILADREQLLGPDHPRTLAARDNLAAAYRAAGQAR